VGGTARMTRGGGALGAATNETSAGRAAAAIPVGDLDAGLVVGGEDGVEVAGDVASEVKLVSRAASTSHSVPPALMLRYQAVTEYRSSN
jgi:hypothetical protein